MRELQPTGRYEWDRILRRCKLGHKVKLVAYTMAQYADADGSRVRPGVPRLAAECEMGQSTIRRYVDELLRLGFLRRVSNGGGPAKLAALYQLTTPSDLLEWAVMLDPEG